MQRGLVIAKLAELLPGFTPLEMDALDSLGNIRQYKNTPPSTPSSQRFGISPISFFTSAICFAERKMKGILFESTHLEPLCLYRLMASSGSSASVDYTC